MNKIISGKVCSGKQVARQIGFPTANVICEHSYQPGVYSGTIDSMDCIIYITPNLIECHIPNWEGDLYNQEVNVCIDIFIRKDLSFECLDQVVTQIKKDIVIYNLIQSLKGIQGKSFVSFSGGKESCILIDILFRLGKDFDVVHFKPKEFDILPFIETFLKGYNKKLIIKEYTSFENAVKEFDHYTNCFLGVRKSDSSFKDSTWLKNCEIIKPLFEWSYADVWNYIENFNVTVSEKYSQGYSSVGYNNSPNLLLKRFDNGYIHAKYLKNTTTERKKY